MQIWCHWAKNKVRQNDCSSTTATYKNNEPFLKNQNHIFNHFNPQRSFQFKTYLVTKRTIASRGRLSGCFDMLPYGWGNHALELLTHDRFIWVGGWERRSDKHCGRNVKSSRLYSTRAGQKLTSVNSSMPTVVLRRTSIIEPVPFKFSSYSTRN